MAPADDRMAFLVKGKGPAARGRFALGPAGANIHFSAELLFRSIGAAGRLGAAPSGSQWFRVTADAGADFFELELRGLERDEEHVDHRVAKRARGDVLLRALSRLQYA